MEDISLHILDIAENAVNAGATLVEISLVEDREKDLLSVRVSDNGRGIPADRIREVLSPFFTTRTTRKVGLGLSLFAQAARETGGDLSIVSAEGKGTTVTATFHPGHIDMKPLGNLTDTLVVMVTGNPRVDYTLSLCRGDASFFFDSRQTKEDLGDIPVNSPAVLPVLRDYLARSIKGIL
jgi:anti-sigma regulatory factor (Ser/Thr protein kinase)